MGNPQLLSDKRTNPSTNDYLFISYSHSDSDFVYNDLNNLYDYQLNFWYDKELLAGEKWDLVVKKIIESSNCKGVILYITESSLISDAVEKEIGIYFKIQSENPNFIIILVSPHKKSVLEIIRDIFISLKDYPADKLKEKFPQKRLQNIVNNLTENIIFISPTDGNSKAHIEEICRTLKKNNINVFSDDESMLETIKNKMNIKSIDGKMVCEFGSYPMSTIVENLRFEEGIKEYNSKKYFTLNKYCFLFEKLRWNILRVDKLFLELCCFNAIKCERIDKIEYFFNDQFINVAFSRENNAITNIDLPNYDRIDELKSLYDEGLMKTKFSNLKLPTMTVEVFAFKKDNNFVLVNKDFKKLNIPIKPNMYVYIIPVVTLDVSKIMKKE